MHLTILTAWLLAAMNTWAPYRAEASAPFRESVAGDVAAVAYDPEEAPLFAGPDGRARTALLLTSVAFHESTFREDIADGHCRPTECDHGRAFGLMQIQPGTGLVLVGDEWDYAARREGATPIRGADLVADRQLTFRMALHMMRASFRHVHSLGEYTGEGSDGPQARWRLERAKRWAKTHPVPLADAEVYEAATALL